MEKITFSLRAVKKYGFFSEEDALIALGAKFLNALNTQHDPSNKG